MRFTNATRLPAAWTLGFQQDGRELLVVVVKATYALPPTGGEAALAADQQPLVEEDRFSGEPGHSAPVLETDYAHRKPACDVLLVGSACAPSGRRVTRLVVGLQVGSMAKQFAVVGPRIWQRGIGGVRAGEPQPFEKLRLTYDVAFGGTDRTEEKEGRTDTYETNPVGCGFGRHSEAVAGRPLPNTEVLGETVSSPRGSYAPMAFSPVGRNWLPRRRWAGTYDADWLENVAPLWPADFDERYFQAAPPEQQTPYPRGGETVVLHNLTPDGHRAFRLPAHPMPVIFIPHRGMDARREAVLDTILIEPDAERFSLTWRTTLPLARSVFDVEETVVGDMPLGWHRARQFPAKRYYSSLAQAVSDLRRRRPEA